MPDSRFEMHPASTALAIATTNRKLVATEVFNEVSTGPAYYYPTLAASTAFTAPDTLVGRTSRPRTVEFSSAMTEASVFDHFLDNPIPVREQLAADDASVITSHNPKILASAEIFAGLVRLRQEYRVASLVFNPNTYSATNRTTLLSGSQFNNTSFDAFTFLTNLINAQIVKPNLLVIGQEGWLPLSRNPFIVEAVRGTGAGSSAIGRVTADELAPLLELDKIVVGEPFINTGTINNPVYSRCWGKHAALIYRADSIPAMDYAYTFGVIPVWGESMKSMVHFDPMTGALGSIINRVGRHTDERVIASEFAHLMINVVP